MNRREFSSVCLPLWAASMGLSGSPAHALSLGDLSQGDASQGLKLALEKSANAAVSLLGRADGFMGNDRVKIALPGYLEDAAKLMRNFGQGQKLDELILAMNRAAEMAVPLARDLLTQSVKTMSVSDAKKILSGGETSITQFFAEKTRAPLETKFLPIVNQATQKVGLAEKYNQVAGKASEFGLVKKEDANLQRYVTAKTLDGLYVIIGDEEKKIRKDPVGTGSALLKKVFGAL